MERQLLPFLVPLRTVSSWETPSSAFSATDFVLAVRPFLSGTTKRRFMVMVDGGRWRLEASSSSQTSNHHDGAWSTSHYSPYSLYLMILGGTMQSTHTTTTLLHRWWQASSPPHTEKDILWNERHRSLTSSSSPLLWKPRESQSPSPHGLATSRESRLRSAMTAVWGHSIEGLMNSPLSRLITHGALFLPDTWYISHIYAWGQDIYYSRHIHKLMLVVAVVAVLTFMMGGGGRAGGI